ncbi:DUF2586 family protein [Soonwooa sp.]|uniref:DUF2586 family protein n=1 Tax=Soonwooa sp. TaxID=1938592 RepID=UPI0028B0B724|nr:DUF2586 family protein [Soonwooa sp.]
MGNLQGTKINKIDGGNGRLSNTNARVFLLVGALAVAGTSLTANESVRLIQTKDIEALGITESFDANKKSLAYYHVSEAFRLAPDATFHFLPVEDGTTIEGSFTAVLQTLKLNPDIKGIGFFGFDGTLETVGATAELIQSGLVLEAKKSGILLDSVLIEAGSPGQLLINNYPDFTLVDAQNVSIVNAQDPDIASLDAAYVNHAAIGTALGSLAVRKMSENIGSTSIENKPDEKKTSVFYSLTDTTPKRFVKAGLSTGQNIADLSDQQIKDLVDKGHVLIGPYVGAAGMYFSSSATCTSKTSKYSTIENNAVWNGAARLISEALAPYIKGKVKKDPATGYIRSTTISHWERVVTKACIERLEAENEISGGSIYINPKQTPNAETPLKISVTIVSDEIAHTFDVDLSIT